MSAYQRYQIKNLTEMYKYYNSATCVIISESYWILLDLQEI